MRGGRRDDAKIAKPADDQLDCDCGQQNAEDDLRDDQTGRLHALGERVDVGKHHIVQRSDDQDQAYDE